MQTEVNIQEPDPKNYLPSGAIAFFFGVIAVYTVVWLLFYIILVKRG